MMDTKDRLPLTLNNLKQAVEQLNMSELEAFTQDVLLLRAERRANRLSTTETKLLQQINNGIPLFSDKHYRELIAKRQAETLTAIEQGELLSMTEQAEKYSVARLEALIQLANLRGTSLDRLMQELGIRAQPYA